MTVLKASKEKRRNWKKSSKSNVKYGKYVILFLHSSGTIDSEVKWNFMKLKVVLKFLLGDLRDVFKIH